jgi:mannose-6-phosphate isomerase-like protein (cupin superfamily)
VSTELTAAYGSVRSNIEAPMSSFVLLLAGLIFQTSSSDLPPGVTIWQNGSPPKEGAKSASSNNYALSTKTRKENGQVEVHDKKTDIMIIQSGEATLLLGGTVLNPQSIGPGETHGTGISGGTRRTISPGDVVVIKAGVPHQFLIAPQRQITYILVKVTSE